MCFRERIANYILLRHIEDSYWEPHNDGTNLGTAYYKIDQKWLNIAEIIGGCGYKELILKAVGQRYLNEHDSKGALL